MSTNFYASAACAHPCDHCRPEELHIGKRSAGWTFAPICGLTWPGGVP